MRSGIVVPRPQITGPRAFRDKLGKSFVKPARDSIRVIPMQNHVRDFVPEDVAARLKTRVALNEKAALRLNASRPGLELSGVLKLAPVFRLLKNVDVRFCVARGLVALKFLRHDAIMEFGLNRNGRRHQRVGKMINEMVGLGVFPLLRTNGEGLLPERTRIALAQAREFNFRQGVETRRRRLRESGGSDQ